MLNLALLQGSLKIYKIPLPPDIEDSTITGGDPQYGLFQGLPGNDPVHVLVRIYIVKVGVTTGCHVGTPVTSPGRYLYPN